jgi:murein DD-endopeptidase MepM/ murein hydrolase activator NlpD
MKYLAFLLLCTLVSGACAQTSVPVPSEKLTISPGEVRWIEFPLTSDEAKLFCREKEVKFVKKGDVGVAFVMETYFSDLSSYKCRVVINQKTTYQFNVKVADRVFKSETLRVDPKTIKLSEKDQLRVSKEQKVLNKIYASSVSDFLFTESFISPMTSQVTSLYGTRRVYNGQKKGQHLGIDYRAAVGDKVPVANAGKVVLAKDLFYTGYTVIIDHGMDIFTVYGHLSKTLVTGGDIVKRGDIIGLSGNTGRTSGPHLHWGVKIQGQYIDGFVLIEETKKKFVN